jgi:homopolymeric O-antigen transport system permease protein
VYSETIGTGGVDTATVGVFASGRRSLFKEAWTELVETVRYRPLIRALVSTSLRTENVGTVFGYLWWLLDPLLLAGVYIIVIDVILRRGGPDFGVFVLTSVISWKYFAGGVRNAIGVTLGKERQMRQVRFPRVILPMSSILTETVRFAFGLVVVIAVASGYYGIYPHRTLPLVLAVAAVQGVFALGVAFFLSSLNVFFRDVQHAVAYFFQAWFFLSPGLYTISTVPAQYRDIYELNPFATILPAYHAILLEHRFPDLTALGIVAALAVALLAAGFLFFVRLAGSFAKVN